MYTDTSETIPHPASNIIHSPGQNHWKCAILTHPHAVLHPLDVHGLLCIQLSEYEKTKIVAYPRTYRISFCLLDPLLPRVSL